MATGGEEIPRHRQCRSFVVYIIFFRSSEEFRQKQLKFFPIVTLWRMSERQNDGKLN